MNGLMRPKGSAAKLEARRRMAAKMLAKGQGIREVARTIGAAPSSVKRWKDALEQGGKDALKAKPHTGRPSRLSAKERQHLLRILKQGPRAANLRADQWTCQRVGTIIRRRFGVKYHPDHVSRILRAMGWNSRENGKKPVKPIKSPNNRLRWAHFSRRHR
jgi:transposase